jgi:7,8-dihydroneopterin aldolase/epimerase/oxygenase
MSAEQAETSLQQPRATIVRRLTFAHTQGKRAEPQQPGLQFATSCVRRHALRRLFLNPSPTGASAVALPAAAADAVLDLIFIEGFTAQTVIGIHDSELHQAQSLVIDVAAGLPRALACDSDHIHDTIDYSVVRDRLLRLMAEHRLQLLEALAEAIANILLHEFGAAWVRVKVVKPKKFADLHAVGVQIERRASAPGGSTQSARHQRAAAVLHLIGSGMVPDTH